MDPMIARRTWRTLEPIHGMIYFVGEAVDAYAAIGVTGRSGYFGSRSAPMGAVGTEVVQATFFNFHPALVRAGMDGLWTRTDPAALVVARFAAVDAALRRAWGDDLDSDDLVRAAAIARRAAEAATEFVDGRPLFAGHASLDWPEAPHLVLWHAQTLLREFRGDGHVAILVAEGLCGLGALVLHAATGDVPRAALQTTRSWSDDEWAGAVADLADRGLVDREGGFTEAGTRLRTSIEERTDALAAAPYRSIGEDGCAELRSLARRFSKAVLDAGLLRIGTDATG
jgi:hypothetical protein